MTGPPSPDSDAETLRAELDMCKRQLVEAHQLTAVGQLLAAVVHEINTPIGSILSNNEVSLRSIRVLKEMLEQAVVAGSAPPPKAVQILTTLESLASVDKIACERIASVIRGLKTLVGGVKREYVMADINEILDNTLKLARCEFRRRVQVETGYGDIPPVCCEPHQLGQVFLNLLVNAGQAIEGEGRVLVRTSCEGGQVHISIEDNGTGIPIENRPKIFSPGFTTKAAGVGTGLGLAISRDIVEGHGGTIEFSSEVGRGTTFRIRIPVERAGSGCRT